MTDIHTGYKRTDFCIGDRVIILAKESKHFGHKGTVSCMAQPVFIRVKPDNPIGHYHNPKGALYYARELEPLEQGQPQWEL